MIDEELTAGDVFGTTGQGARVAAAWERWAAAARRVTILKARRDCAVAKSKSDSEWLIALAEDLADAQVEADLARHAFARESAKQTSQLFSVADRALV